MSNDIVLPPLKDDRAQFPVFDISLIEELHRQRYVQLVSNVKKTLTPGTLASFSSFVKVATVYPWPCVTFVDRHHSIINNLYKPFVVSPKSPCMVIATNFDHNANPWCYVCVEGSLGYVLALHITRIPNVIDMKKKLTAKV